MVSELKFVENNFHTWHGLLIFRPCHRLQVFPCLVPVTLFTSKFERLIALFVSRSRSVIFYLLTMMCLILNSTVFFLFSSLASRNVSDWWLAYWISHSRVTNSTANHVNATTTYHLNHVIPRVLHADQLGMHVHIVKNTVTFYLVVYGGLAVANTVRIFVAFETSRPLFSFQF